MNCKPSPAIEVPVSSKNANWKNKISDTPVTANWITSNLKWSPEHNYDIRRTNFSQMCFMCWQLMSIVVQSVNINLLIYTCEQTKQRRTRTAFNSGPNWIIFSFIFFHFCWERFQIKDMAGFQEESMSDDYNETDSDEEVNFNCIRMCDNYVNITNDYLLKLFPVARCFRTRRSQARSKHWSWRWRQKSGNQ